ncbi:MAG TPA: hypothetical protein VF318_01120 [Dehalococcoidales bacterium]
MNALQIKLAYEWQTVLLREKVEYLFPMAISPFMRTRYKGPAIFKWEVYQTTPGDKKMVYIGEAQELCPKRLYGYLNPGSTQLANKKVNTEFRGYLKEHLKIKLEVCEIQELTLGESLFDMKALNDKHVRRLVSELMIVEHTGRGFTVMDL